MPNSGTAAITTITSMIQDTSVHDLSPGPANEDDRAAYATGIAEERFAIHEYLLKQKLISCKVGLAERSILLGSS
jgi:hypothetical protein